MCIYDQKQLYFSFNHAYVSNHAYVYSSEAALKQFYIRAVFPISSLLSRTLFSMKQFYEAVLYSSIHSVQIFKKKKIIIIHFIYLYIIELSELVMESTLHLITSIGDTDMWIHAYIGHMHIP